MVDKTDLKSVGQLVVWVQVPPRVQKYSQVAELAYKPLALPITGEMGMYNTITGSNPVLTTKCVWLIQPCEIA